MFAFHYCELFDCLVWMRSGFQGELSFSLLYSIPISKINLVFMSVLRWLAFGSLASRLLHLSTSTFRVELWVTKEKKRKRLNTFQIFNNIICCPSYFPATYFTLINETNLMVDGSWVGWGSRSNFDTGWKEESTMRFSLSLLLNQKKEWSWRCLFAVSCFSSGDVRYWVS